MSTSKLGPFLLFHREFRRECVLSAHRFSRLANMLFFFMRLVSCKCLPTLLIFILKPLLVSFIYFSYLFFVCRALRCHSVCECWVRVLSQAFNAIVCKNVTLLQWIHCQIYIEVDDDVIYSFLTLFSIYSFQRFTWRAHTHHTVATMFSAIRLYGPEQLTHTRNVYSAFEADRSIFSTVNEIKYLCRDSFCLFSFRFAFRWVSFQGGRIIDENAVLRDFQ